MSRSPGQLVHRRDETAEPLEYRRLRIHGFSTGAGTAAGLAAGLVSGYWGAFLVGLVLGFLTAGLLERWLLAKRLSVGAPRVFVAYVLIGSGAGLLVQPLLILAAALGASLVAARLITAGLPDVWPPRDDVCSECGYDLRGLPGPACPECGHDRSDPNLCKECGYDLTGVAALVCPECGTGLIHDIEQHSSAVQTDAEG